MKKDKREKEVKYDKTNQKRKKNKIEKKKKKKGNTSSQCLQMGPREPPLRGANSKKPIVSGLSDRGHGKQRGQRTKTPGSHPRGSPDLETATRPNAALQPRRREQRWPSEPGTQAKGGGGGRKSSARCQQTAPRKPPAQARGTQAPAPPRPGTPATESRGVNEQRPRDPTHAGAQTQKQPHARTQLHSPAGESRDSTRTQAPRQKEGEAAEKGPLGASKRLPESPQPGRVEPKHQHPPAQRPWPRKAGDPQLRRRGVGGGRARTAVYRSFCLRPDALQGCSPVCWSPIGIQDGGSALR
ncbi:uncharacterized protein PS065_020222 [Dugong dugon]